MEKVKQELTKEEKRQRQLANLKTFRPVDQLTEEEKAEQDAIREKGKIALREYHQKKKSLKDQAQALLDTVLSREQLERIVGDSAELISDNEITVASAVLLSALREGTVNGNIKGLEFIRDTSGNAPKVVSQLDIQADIMTDADRSLMEKVGNRLKLG